MTIDKLNGTECGTEIAKKINKIIDEKASVSLDNLDTDGQAILDSKVNSSDLFDENEHIKINKLQSYSLPSAQYIDLTLGASGSTYTAPANGWVTFTAYTQGVRYDANITLAVGDLTNFRACIAPGEYETILVPVQKNQNFVAYYTNITLVFFRFFYAVGSAPA